MQRKATEAVSGFFNNVINWFKQLPGNIWNWLVQTITNIYNWGQQIQQKAINAVKNLFNNVINWFKQLPGNIWNWLVQTVTKIAQWGINMQNKAKSAMSNMVNGIINAIKGLPGKVWEIGKNIVTGIWEGISGMASWLWDKISGWCSSIFDSIKSFFGIHSPSKLFADEVGRMLGLGVGEGFDDSLSSVYKDMERAINYENDKLTSNLTNNQLIRTQIEDSRQATLKSIDNNKEIVVNSTTKLDSKVIARETNKVNARRQLQYSY